MMSRTTTGRPRRASPARRDPGGARETAENPTATG